MIGTAIDIAAATLAMHALPMASTGIALMLVFNIGAAALLLPLRYGLGGAYGYGHIALDSKAAAVSFRTVDDVRDPKSGITTRARFAVEAGDPGVKQA